MGWKNRATPLAAGGKSIRRIRKGLFFHPIITFYNHVQM